LLFFNEPLYRKSSWISRTDWIVLLFYSTLQAHAIYRPLEQFTMELEENEDMYGKSGRKQNRKQKKAMHTQMNLQSL